MIPRPRQLEIIKFLREVFPDALWVTPTLRLVTVGLPYEIRVSIRYNTSPKGWVRGNKSNFLEMPLDLNNWDDVIGFVSAAWGIYNKIDRVFKEVTIR